MTSDPHARITEISEQMAALLNEAEDLDYELDEDDEGCWFGFRDQHGALIVSVAMNLLPDGRPTTWDVHRNPPTINAVGCVEGQERPVPRSMGMGAGPGDLSAREGFGEVDGPLEPLSDDPRFIVHALAWLNSPTGNLCGAEGGRRTVRTEAIECPTCFHLKTARSQP